MLEHQSALPALSEEEVQDMLVLAERLRQANGGTLDDSAIAAVSEATGTPVEYVRLAVHMMPHKKSQSLSSSLQRTIVQFDPVTRQSVITAGLAAFAAMFFVLSLKVATPTGATFLTTLQLIAIGTGLWNIALIKDTRMAATNGAIGFGVFFVAQSLFSFMANVPTGLQAAALPIFLVLGALTGLILQKVISRNSGRLGLQDPLQERQKLLTELVALQDKLRSGEQLLTFVSVDIVNSTQMKAIADPLSVEFTFSEYQQYVERVARQFTGRVHSTAGDGTILAFETPQHAFAASRNLLTGLIEFNTFRNKLNSPISVRIGIHAGPVVTPQAGDITSVSYTHVIDMAAHIQKTCPPGAIGVSEQAAVYLKGGVDAIAPESITVMDQKVRIWMPRRALPGPGEADAQ